MKAKVVGLLVLVAHITVLAGFSLLQGCTTGDCPIPWLNWPYSTSYEPIIVPADDFAPIPSDEFAPVPMLSPSGFTAEPYAGAESKAYTVQKGDTLSSIASMYSTSWKKLAEFNGLSDPNKLRVGQEIRIPSSLGAPAPRPKARPAAKKAPSTPIKQAAPMSFKRAARFPASPSAPAFPSANSKRPTVSPATALLPARA